MSTRNSMKFLPILNFDFGETPVLSADDELFFYESALRVLAKSFKEIEISFVSDAFVFNSKRILELISKLGLKLAIGSIYEPEQVSELKRIFKEASFEQEDTKIFSPVYQDDFAEILGDGFKYVPGFFKKEDLIKRDLVKIFPFNVTSAKSLYAKLCKPYPELRKSIYQSKLFFASPELVDKYKVFENVKIDDNSSKYIEAKSGDQIFIVDSPLSYQKVRSKFLFNPRVKLFFNFETKIDEKELLDLAKESTVYLTGIKQEYLSDELLKQPNVIIATRVFTNTVKDLLAGQIKNQNLEACLEKEVFSTSTSTRGKSGILND